MRRTSTRANVFHIIEPCGSNILRGSFLCYNCCQGSATSTFLTRNLARFQTNSINKRPYAGSTPAAGSTQPRKTLYLAFCGAFLFGMRILLEWILERGNGVNVGRRDLISEGMAVDILECGSVRPSAAFLDVGIGDVQIVEI